MDCLGVPGAGYMPTRKESCNGLILPKKNIGNFSSKIQKTIHLIFHELILQTMNIGAPVPIPDICHFFLHRQDFRRIKFTPKNA